MIDLFSSQFQFSIQHRRGGRETIFGKLLSTAILVIAISYLIYLSIKLQSNEILPKIVHFTDRNEFSNSYEYNYSPISIDITFNGDAITDFSKYLKYFSVYVGTYEYKEGKTDKQELELVNCQQKYRENIQLYSETELCLQGYIKLQTQTFYGDREAALSSGLQVGIKKCIQQQDQQGKNDGECASIQEIEDFIRRNTILIITKMHVREFNYKKREMQKNMQVNFLQLNQQMTTSLEYRLLKSRAIIDDALIIKNNHVYNYISEYFIEKHYTSDNTHLSPWVATMQFTLQPQIKVQDVEYTKLTEIFAQVSSLFASLCFLGIIAKFFSDALIFQDLTFNYLKYYYSTTRKQFHELKEDKNKTDLNDFYNKLSLINPKNLYWYFKELYLNDPPEDQDSLDIQTKKDRKSVLQRQKSVQKKYQVFKSKVKKRNNYIDILDIAKDNLDLNKVFQEIWELKTCVHLLLSEEQYAAVKYTRRNLPNQNFLNQISQFQYEQQILEKETNKYKVEERDEEKQEKNNMNKVEKIIKCSQFKKLNHLEKLDLIDKNAIICDIFYQQFKENKFQTSRNINECISGCLLENSGNTYQEEEVQMGFMSKLYGKELLSSRETMMASSRKSRKCRNPISEIQLDLENENSVSGKIKTWNLETNNELVASKSKFKE